MFKKHVFIIAVGAMFSVPAFADATSEGVIYQIDQDLSNASINQVVDDGLATFAAIEQIDSTTAGATTNTATIVQGSSDGSAAVEVDSTGAFATNNATTLFNGVVDANGNPINATGSSFAVNDLSGYTDAYTGDVPFAYTVTNTSSNNYAVVSQDGQTNAQALIIQASSEETDVQIPLQTSLAAMGGIVDFHLIDNNQAAQDIEVTYTGDAITIGGLLVNGVTLNGFADPGIAGVFGNIGVIAQGADLSNAITPNGVTLDIDQGPQGTVGDSEVALIIQASTNSYAFIGQNGSNDSAAIIQNQDSNYAEILQYSAAGDMASNNNFAFTSQIGNFNLSQTYQSGSYNDAYVFQFGDGNIAAVDQLGNNAIAFVYQSNTVGGGDVATGNNASIYQHAVQ